MTRRLDRVRRLTLVAGQGEIGGGEQMLLRIGEAATDLGWKVQVLGPRWGSLGRACGVRNLSYEALCGRNRRTYALCAAARLSMTGQGLVWANGAFPALAATGTPNPLVVHLHQVPTRLQSLAIQPALARARGVVVPSNSMRRRVHRNARVMPNWTQDYSLMTRRPSAGCFTVAYLGRLSVDKGLDTLVEAVDALVARREVPQVRLLIAGDSRFVDAESARRVAQALGSCSAEVVREEWTEPSEILDRADVVVVPSRAPESFGLVAAEAMAMGCPLIVSDAGALPEVVGRDYQWIFPAGDAEALGRLLACVTKSDTELAVKKMRSRWEEYFAPDTGRERIGEILGHLDPQAPLASSWGREA